MSIVRVQYIPVNSSLAFRNNTNTLNLELYTNTTAGIDQYSQVGWTIKVLQNFILQGATATTGDIIKVSNLNGTTIGTYSATTFGTIAELFAGETYIISFTRINTSINTIDTLLGYIRASLSSTVSDFFTNVNVVTPLPSGITSTVDVNGTITLTFTSVSLTTATDINLAYFEVAKSSGTFTVTSSDASVLDSYNQAFVANNSVAYIAYPKITTVFTGTVVLSITGVGVPSTKPFFWIPSNFDPLAAQQVVFATRSLLLTPPEPVIDAKRARLF